MTEENKTDKKKCGGKGKAMFAYGIIQLGSSVVSALALTAIALSFCSLKQESKVFNECVEDPSYWQEFIRCSSLLQWW